MSLVAGAVVYAARTVAAAVDRHAKACTGFFGTDVDYEKAYVDLNELVAAKIAEDDDVDYSDLELEVS